MTTRRTSLRRWLAAEVVTTEKRYVRVMRLAMISLLSFATLGFAMLLVQREAWKLVVETDAFALGSKTAHEALRDGKTIPEEFATDHGEASMLGRFLGNPIYFRDRHYIDGLQSAPDSNTTEQAPITTK